MEARYIELGLGKRHGFVVGMERLSGVKRATMNGWFQRNSQPRLDALGEVARILQLSRAELVAAFDGQELITYDRARLIVREELAAAQDVTPAASTPESSPGWNGGTAPRRSAA